MSNQQRILDRVSEYLDIARGCDNDYRDLASIYDRHAPLALRYLATRNLNKANEEVTYMRNITALELEQQQWANQEAQAHVVNQLRK